MRFQRKPKIYCSLFWKDTDRSLPSWKLSSLSHGEFSWKKARQGLESGEDGNVKLLLDAMKVDATKELMNRSTTIT